MRYFLQLAYNGLAFHGWQAQPNAVSVQSRLEDSLSTLCREKIAVTGAGRTDAGVHARKMYAHFDWDKKPEDPDKFLLSLNRLSGKDISIQGIAKVADDANARFDACERVYKYFVAYEKNPFLRDLCWMSPSRLDISRMNYVAEYLLTTEDFTSFAKLHSDVKTNICDVREAVWREIKEDREAEDFMGVLEGGVVFTIRADRFLRNMVRAIVGTLVDVGRNKLSKDGFVKIIKSKDRCNAGTSMPANGLFLWDVKYPYKIEFLNRH